GGGAASGQVVVANTSAHPLPVAPQGTTSITGSVGINNTGANPVPVAVQGETTGSVRVTNTGDNPLPVSMQNTMTTQLDQAASGHLTNVDAATSKLSFDASGNLK